MKFISKAIATQHYKGGEENFAMMLVIIIITTIISSNNSNKREHFETRRILIFCRIKTRIFTLNNQLLVINNFKSVNDGQFWLIIHSMSSLQPGTTEKTRKKR